MEDIIELRSPNASRRAPAGGFATPVMREQSRRIIEKIGGPPSQRASQMKRSTQPAYNTEDDAQIAPSTRPARMQTGHAAYRHTEDDAQIAPSTRPARMQTGTYRQKHKRRMSGRTFFFVGLGMVVMLILWAIGVHVYASCMNTISDPYYYAQSAHRDVALLTDATGKQYQTHAFVDTQDRLDLLIIPAEGDTSKARIMVGPQLDMINDPQHKALLEVKILQGTQIIISASGPYEVSWLEASRYQSTQWIADTSKQKGSQS